MFNREQSFDLPKVRLMLTLGALMLLLLALVFMNAVLAAGADSHAIGASKTFPEGRVAASLTVDLIVAYLVALLTALGTLVLPRLYKTATNRPSIPQWLSSLGWALIALGAFLIALAGFCMPLQLASFQPEKWLWPPVDQWAAGLMSRPWSHIWITLLRASNCSRPTWCVGA
jgi:hypothetical protein